MSQLFISFILFCMISTIYGQTNKQTDCQRDRTRALARDTNSKINLVPKCETNGDYSALQCHTNSTWCQCWTNNGLPVTQPSRKIKRCDCILHRETVRTTSRGAIGAYEPQCAVNGGYQKKQCHGSTGHCWCLNVETGAQVGEKVRGSLECK